MAEGELNVFPVRILTPMDTALTTDAVYVRAPAREGLLGVMANHAPMVAELLIGGAVVTEPSGETRHFAMVEGVLHVKHDEVVIVVGAAEEADRIDVERARRALARARERLRARRRDQVDIRRAELALARAANRLNVAERAGL